jgi:hypothetical protein
MTVLIVPETMAPDLRRLLDRTPLVAALGPQRLFHNLFKALESWQQRVASKANGESPGAGIQSVDVGTARSI